MNQLRVRTALVSLALLSAAGCSSSTPAVSTAAPSISASAPAGAFSTDAGTSAAGAATAEAPAPAATSGTGVSVDCSALTQAQIAAATGGKPDAGKPDTDFSSGCIWVVLGSPLHTAVDEKNRGPVELVLYTQAHNLNQFQLSFPQLTPEPEIGGKLNYWNPALGTNVLAFFDGTKDVQVELVTPVGASDAVLTAKAKTAATALAKDLLGG